MKVEVNEKHCVASGACVLAAPDLFDQDDDGIVLVLEEHPGETRHAAARRAAAACPAQVIHLRDKEGAVA